MIWFLSEIFPKIQQQLGESICLTIAGVINSSRIRELAGPVRSLHRSHSQPRRTVSKGKAVYRAHTIRRRIAA
jgi:hypothetical protein